MCVCVCVCVCACVRACVHACVRYWGDIRVLFVYVSVSGVTSGSCLCM